MSMRAPGSALGDDAVAIDFEGRAIPGRIGESLAAALTAAGELVLREARGGPRGLFCGMGVCQECVVEIGGVARRAAVTLATRSGVQGSMRA